MKKYIFIGVVMVVSMIGAIMDIHWSQPILYRYTITTTGEVMFTNTEGETMIFVNARDLQTCLSDIADILAKNDRGLISLKQNFHWFAAPVTRCEVVAIGDSI